MKTMRHMIIAVSGNALGTALMARSDLGLSAWGFGSTNAANYFGLTLGQGFVVLSVVFYAIAILTRRRFHLREAIHSFLFLIGFALLADGLIAILPPLDGLPLASRISINLVGLCVMLFSVAVHLKVGVAVHPLDVYLHSLQEKFGTLKGTYVSFLSAAFLGVCLGRLGTGLEGFGIGTIFTLSLSGVILNFYNRRFLSSPEFAPIPQKQKTPDRKRGRALPLR